MFFDSCCRKVNSSPCKQEIEVNNNSSEPCCHSGCCDSCIYGRMTASPKDRTIQDFELSVAHYQEAHPLDVQPRYQHVVRAQSSTAPIQSNESVACETLHIVEMNTEPCLVRSYGRYCLLTATKKPLICVAQLCDTDWTIQMNLLKTEAKLVEEGGSLWQFLGPKVASRCVEFDEDRLRIWVIERSVNRALSLIETINWIKNRAPIFALGERGYVAGTKTNFTREMNSRKYTAV